MISRRSLLVGGASLLSATFAARGQVSRISLTGTMEQGTLIVGRTEPSARVAFDDIPLHLMSEGEFACGLEWNRTMPARFSVTFADGLNETRAITPVGRKYVVQRVEGLAPSMVTPPPSALERIHNETLTISEARRRDSDTNWFTEPFDWPAPGVLSGVFGSQRIDNGKEMAPHLGVDVANVEGTPIRAPANGTVSISDDHYLNGGFILLDHGHGVSTSYLHQSRRMVKAGEIVQRGQIIGLMGKTGRATGPHLHWALNWFQVKLDPSRSTRTSAPPSA